MNTWLLAGGIVLLPVLALAGYWLHAGLTHPAINDIATDPAQPLVFRAMPVVVPYPGETFASRQRVAYPQVKPLLLEVAPALAYRAAIDLLHERGWTLVAEDTTELRIEATTRSRIFRFTDEVVLQVTPLPDGARVDMRSRSRVGRSDFGVNAARIEGFLQALGRRLPGT